MNYTDNGTDWQRVSPQTPCPICEKPDWCLIAADGSAAICTRTESDNRRGDAGWLHRLADAPEDARRYEHPGHRRNGRKPNGKPATDWNAKAAAFAENAAEKRRELADVLGVSPEALDALGVGWGNVGGECWTFPERDAAGRPVGINRRFTDASKKSIGRRGLTYPTDWAEADGPILLVEGGSDTAALMTTGLAAIGRPSNRGGVDLLADLLRIVPADREIIVLGERDAKADGDWPGRDGAISTAAALSQRLRRPVGWALPPAGSKDAREWLRANGPDGAAFLRSLKVETFDPPPAAELPAVWMPFPIDRLPDPLYSFVRTASDAIGCDPSMIALPLLSAVAGAVGNTRRIRLKAGWDEPAVVWTAIVSPSGTLKSPAIEAAVKPLAKRQAEAIRRHQEAMDAYGRDLELHKVDLAEWRKTGRKKGDPPPDEPERPACDRLLVGDVTIEALAVRLSENPRGLMLYRDELAGWLGSFNEYKSGKGSDSAHWLSIHGARDLMVDRKNGDRPTLFVRAAAVSICGGIQPEILKSALGRQHFADGMAARLLLAMPPIRPKQWTEAEITEADTEPLQRLFDSLLDLQPATDEAGEPFARTLPLTPDGKSEWIAFYEAHAHEQAELAGDLAAAWSKLEGYAARLALIVHLVREAAGDPTLRTPDAIDGASILAGADLARWFGAEARRVYGVLGESDADRDRRELVELIRRKGGRLTPRDLMHASRQYHPTDVAEAALMDLAQAGWGTWDVIPSGPAGGRPRREFILQEPSP